MKSAREYDLAADDNHECGANRATMSVLGACFMNEMLLNEQLAEQICETRQAKGRWFQLGDYVALLDGQVVGVAQSLEGALQALRAIDPDPRRGMVCEVAPPVPDFIR